MSERNQETHVRRKRRFSLLCLVVIGSILLSGCGGGGNEKATQQDPEDQGSETTSVPATAPATARTTPPTTAPAMSTTPSRRAPSTTPATAQEAPATGPEAVRGDREQLRVAPAGSMSGYSRESFEHWSQANDFGWDVPENSCDAREAALIRDGKNVEVGKGCKVSSGEWFDPYTAQTFTDPSDLDTDHIVPLANAFRSGASSWNNEERERYANDPLVLRNVEDNANQQKGDKGPEAWKPPNQAEWCDYAERWIAIKGKYDLTVNPDEKTALEEMLRACA